MKATRTILALALISLAGCASQNTASQSPAVAIAPASTCPVITKLVGRHGTITVSAGPESALYSVQSPDGKMLVSLVTLDQMRDQHPEYFQWIAPVVALDTRELAVTASSSEE